MKDECTIVFKSQSGQLLILSDRNCGSDDDILDWCSDSTHTLLEFHKQESSRPHKMQNKPNQRLEHMRIKLEPIIDFFSGMPSFEKINITIKSSEDCKHLITMSSQSAVVRILPFILLEACGETLIQGPKMNFFIETHPFLKSGWIQKELQFIIAKELLNNRAGSRLEKVIKAIETNFKRKLEALYFLHNHVVSLESHCSPLCNGLATAIMCVEYTLLNPREMLEQMCLDEQGGENKTHGISIKKDQSKPSKKAKFPCTP